MSFLYNISTSEFRNRLSSSSSSDSRLSSSMQTQTELTPIQLMLFDGECQVVAQAVKVASLVDY